MVTVKGSPLYYTIKLPVRDYKILIVTDMHLIDQEFKNTVGYVEHQEGVLLRIIKGAKEGIYNTVIFLGDLFDRGYNDVSKVLYHISLFEELNTLLQGRVFKVIGNHPLNKKKNTVPTFFLVGKLKSKRLEVKDMVIQNTENGLLSNYGLTNPLIYAPDRLFVNGTLINFFHYSKRNKNYYDDLADLPTQPKYHIGCYHDNIMSDAVRSYVNELSNGNKFSIPSIITAENSGIFKNIDYAMIGDIHTKIGEFKLTNSLTGKTTIADIPGTLGRTANHRAQQHNEVYLPLVTITKEGIVTKEHVHFPLTDYRKIFKVELQEEQKEQKNRLDDFKSAIDILQTPELFSDAVNNADLEERTREILNNTIDDKPIKISYRQNKEYLNMLI